MPKPYQMVRRKAEPVPVSENPPTWRIELELADTPNVSAQREQLVILTHVPVSEHSRNATLELAALRHVQALLSKQIEMMQSP